MSEHPQSPQRQTIFSQIDVTNLVSGAESEIALDASGKDDISQQQMILQNQTLITLQKQFMAQMRQQHSETLSLMREMIGQQRRQNDLLTHLIHLQTSAVRQRTQELHQWRSAHPHLARECRQAAELLNKIQLEYYSKMVEEIENNGDSLEYGDFMINEFIDRFGPRVAHLNGLFQLLSQLAMPPEEDVQKPQEDMF
ncbi:MAG: hypothetical protein Q4C96_05800 [Planctomycetia bacterium]|nr:hypothetical protein [Planctomycetia bacterium]